MYTNFSMSEDKNVQEMVMLHNNVNVTITNEVDTQRYLKCLFFYLTNVLPLQTMTIETTEASEKAWKK